MAYVAVKGGEAAIAAAHDWLARVRRGDLSLAVLDTAQIEAQLGRAVDRVMAEGGLHDPELAALAIRQAQGDLIEAAFLVRAYRTTLPRLIDAEPVDTGAMRLRRRVSAIFKDLPGGQRLGPTTDYTHRLLDLGHQDGFPKPGPQRAPAPNQPTDSVQSPRATDLLGAESLLEADPAPAAEPGDLTMAPLDFPAARDLRLQALARGDEGFLLALGYSTQRGYGHTHPFVGELRMGEVAVSITPPELGFPIEIGDIVLTECQMVNQFAGSKAAPPQFTRGYGLCVGHADRRAIAIALVDRSMRAAELGEDVVAPAQDVEFVLSHCDNIEATGFVEHLKLPHHVDFQSELETIRAMRAKADSVVTNSPETTP
jgi:alpha-D-ribose 1-methylphosphonate 5-triphosphate synthase subunit PhnI